MTTRVRNPTYREIRRSLECEERGSLPLLLWWLSLLLLVLSYSSACCFWLLWLVVLLPLLL